MPVCAGVIKNGNGYENSAAAGYVDKAWQQMHHSK